MTLNIQSNTINNDLYDRSIGHALDARSFENSVVTQHKGIIEDFRKDLRKASSGVDFYKAKERKNFLAAFEKKNAKLISSLSNSAAEEIRDYARAAVDFQVSSIEKGYKQHASSIFKVKRPRTNDILNDIVGTNIYEDGKDKSTGMRQQYNRIGKGQLLRVNTALKNGLKDGLSNDEIIAKLMKSTKLTEAQARTLVRTGITNAQTKSFIASMQSNSAVIKGYRFTATLDSRTSRICAHHDGTVYGLEDTQWFPPLHWNCRSTVTPVVKSFEELLDEKPDGVKLQVLRKLKPKQVKALRGYPPERETFDRWLRRQPHETKLKILETDDNIELFQSNNLPLNNMLNNKGKLHTIAKLRKLDKERTVVYPTRQHVLCKTQQLQLQVDAATPEELIRSKSNRDQLTALLAGDAELFNNPLSLIDYRGILLASKRRNRSKEQGGDTRSREANLVTDPLSGQRFSPNVYPPNYKIYDEYLDLIRNSKNLTEQQKKFLLNYSETLGKLDSKTGKEYMSVNQRSVVMNTLRRSFERYNRDEIPWSNFTAVVRADINKFSVTNVSERLETAVRQKDRVFGRTGAGADKPQMSIGGQWYTLDEISDNLRKNEKYIDTWTETRGRQLARNFYATGKAPWRSYLFGPRKDNIFEVFEFRKNTAKWAKERFGINAINRFSKKLATAIEFILSLPFNIDRLTAEMMVKIRTFPVALLEDFLTSVSSSVQDALDFRFMLTRQTQLEKTREKFLKSFFEPKNASKNIDALSGYMRTVAASDSADFDQLAVNLGRKLRKDYATSPTLKPTLKDYHEDGARIITFLENKKLLRVNTRAATEKGLVDLDSNRVKQGSFRDVIVREIELLDKDMIELNNAHRQVYVGRRLGIVNKRDKLRVTPKTQQYIDARGNKTDISLVTKKAGANFLADEIIDRDFANMLNYAMDVEYKVDQNFSKFFDDLYHFRGGKNDKVAEIDNKNFWRAQINGRGEQGFGLLQTIKYHQQRAKAWTNYYQIDGRGRVYGQGYLTPTTGEVGRPFLETAKAQRFTVDALEELKIQTGAVIGSKSEIATKVIDPKTGKLMKGSFVNETLTQEGREAIFRRHQRELIEFGAIIDGYRFDKTKKQWVKYEQQNKRLHDFLDHEFNFHDDEGKELPRLARMALEWSRLYRHNGGFERKSFSDVDIDFYLSDDMLRTRSTKYRTTMTIENDASSSGAQIIGLSTGDRAVSEISNVLPTTSKQRLYDIIAQATASSPRFEAINRLGSDIDWQDLAKGAKAQNMVTFYGAGEATQTMNIRDKLAGQLTGKKIDGDSDGGNAYTLIFEKINEVPKKFKDPKTGSILQKYKNQVYVLDDVTSDIDSRIAQAKQIGAKDVMDELSELKAAFKDSMINDADVGSKLLAHAGDISQDAADLVDKMYNSRTAIVSTNEFKKVSEIMSDFLADEAPVTKYFINKWKEIAGGHYEDPRTGEILVQLTQHKFINRRTGDTFSRNAATKVAGYIERTGSTRMPWVTFDNKKLSQIYPPKVEAAINWTDPVTGRKITNVIQDVVEDTSIVKGRGAVGDAVTGLGVNGNHMNDAAIVRQAHLWARKTSTPHSTIHDAFFTNIVDARKLKTALRGIYADARGGKTIPRTLKAIRADGRKQIRLSKEQRTKDYDTFEGKVKSAAKERKLMMSTVSKIDDNKFTKQDLSDMLTENPDFIVRLNRALATRGFSLDSRGKFQRDINKKMADTPQSRKELLDSFENFRVAQAANKLDEIQDIAKVNEKAFEGELEDLLRLNPELVNTINSKLGTKLSRSDIVNKFFRDGEPNLKDAVNSIKEVRDFRGNLIRNRKNQLKLALEQSPKAVTQIRNELGRRYSIDEIAERYTGSKLNTAQLRKEAGQQVKILDTRLKDDLRAAAVLNSGLEAEILRRTGIDMSKYAQKLKTGELTVEEILLAVAKQRKKVNSSIRKDLKDFDKWWNKSLAHFKELGLINPENEVTAKEIISPIKDGQDWYGIGP